MSDTDPIDWTSPAQRAVRPALGPVEPVTTILREAAARAVAPASA
jgi:hypothetical protein